MNFQSKLNLSLIARRSKHGGPVFEIASIDHFGYVGDFEVFRRRGRKPDSGCSEIAEIGCGHGLVAGGRSKIPTGEK